MKHILNTLGLTREEVSDFFKTKGSVTQTEEDKNYLLAVDQKRIRRRLKENMPFIITRWDNGRYY